MKKLLGKMLAITILAGVIGQTLFISNTNAYALSADKEQVISQYLPSNVEQAITNIVKKWNKQKQFDVYNKFKKVILNQQMAIVSNTTHTEAKKQELINKLNAFLFVLEKSLDDSFKPKNNTGDSI